MVPPVRNRNRRQIKKKKWRRVTLSPEVFALSLLVYEQFSSRLVQAFVVCGAVRRSWGASTQSAFLYAAMTVLSRAVSPHQQPSILIAQPKSQSKLWPPHSHHNQSNQRKQQAKTTTGTNYHQVASKVPHSTMCSPKIVPQCVCVCV